VDHGTQHKDDNGRQQDREEQGHEGHHGDLCSCGGSVSDREQSVVAMEQADDAARPHLREESDSIPSAQATGGADPVA